MLGSELYAIIYEWADLVLNTEQALNIPIIQARQNTPAPAENYIAIPIAPDTSNIGHEILLDYNEDNPGEQVKFVQEDEATLILREVGGSGDNLRRIINSLPRQSIQDFFRSKFVSVLRKGTIQGIPNLVEDQWSEEWVIEIVFQINEIPSESTTYIETIEFINNIGEGI